MRRTGKQWRARQPPEYAHSHCTASSDHSWTRPQMACPCKITSAVRWTSIAAPRFPHGVVHPCRNQKWEIDSWWKRRDKCKRTSERVATRQFHLGRVSKFKFDSALDCQIPMELEDINQAIGFCLRAFQLIKRRRTDHHLHSVPRNR